MSTVLQSSLTILFEAPFWIGLYERTDSGKYEVCKITFGSEPKDYGRWSHCSLAGVVAGLSEGRVEQLCL